MEAFSVKETKVRSNLVKTVQYYFYKSLKSFLSALFTMKLKEIVTY